MNLSEIREHGKLVAKAFLFYRKGFEYMWMRYVIAPKILFAGAYEHKPVREDVSMHMLFGARDFLMGLWSLASFYRVMPEVGELVVHSDGTLTKRHMGAIKKLFPQARIEDAKEFMTLHGDSLSAYPVLKNFREVYPKFQSKKLIDQYVLSGKKFRILLDSDILWFKEPTEITASLKAGVPKPLMMTNQDAYVHVQFADGTTTTDEVAKANSGIVVYREDQFSLEAMQEYVQKTDYLGKKFTDQACFASILKPELLSESTYIIKGTLTDSIIMRHYTSPSRAKFFFYGLNHIWKDILNHVRN
jgi:hypothetical protein